MNDLEFVGDWRQPQLSARQRALGHDGTSAGDFTFGDFLDIINPLQHIPLVSNIYRAITGDEIRPHARILGDTLFGGPTGFLSAVANTLYEEIAGEDVGETVIAFFTGEDGDTTEPQFADDSGGAPMPLETAAGAAPAAEDPGAVLPKAAPGMLTGQDALNALYLDLSGQRQQEPRLPAAAVDGAGARSYPLPPRSRPAPAPAGTPLPAATGAGPAVHPLLFAQEAADGAIADRMMQALDKYETMARQGAGKPREADEPRQDEPMRWQSDPAAEPGPHRL